MMLGPHLGIAVGLLVLVGCGNPAPNLPAAGPTTEAADAGRTDRAVRLPGGPAPTQIARLSSTTSRSGNPVSEGRIPPAVAVLPDPSHSDRYAIADQAQYEARQQWLAELRAHPDAAVRLQALTLWARDPDDGLETVMEGLEDDDEQVRTRAGEIWEQQLAQEEGASDIVEE
ncbi:MAG: hypothetical protein HP477_10620 [Nitrospira sp.]|nr:hypothetical protein [Nitrospira sp.]